MGHLKSESYNDLKQLFINGDITYQEFLVRDTIATSTGSARFSTNDEEFFTQVNQLLLDSSKKLTIIACIELDVSNDKERKAKMGIWMQTLKQKLSWLHPAKISVNSVDNITDIIPDLNVSFI